ncbi:alpha-ketoglutarate-dependent dioxygenase AlkB [Geminocystis sp. GBBB08]|uniref:alpha-ketoglutarate-dependent dioxygenase AlkB family protein n=1 Tax=Geminocystis sp. GBBB08 TaxID=2604140 RepID=UPI0027E28840|nr:alpha-ketoglutarate-dependent dioxygenase AlkB [Geminocystis sp. GBBB08]MBL1210487.1 alpha-ketoglutarate-dependent dioxygenase AlkB [Geminocystis sp. GBBB08]
MTTVKTLEHDWVNKLPEQLLSTDGDALLYQEFLEQEKADNYLSVLKDTILWKHQPIKLFGKEILQPRLTAYFGEGQYHYSGIAMEAQIFPPILLELKAQIDKVSGVQFNAVLLNLYRDGNDNIGWHSDDESDLAEGSVIASLSLGETRRFIFRRRDNHSCRIERKLSHGDLLIMRDQTQKFWQHQVPKTGKKIAPKIQPRINLTFRVININ